MSKREQRSVAFRFRRFCRGGCAAFSSMHREVTIGHVASYIADRQLRKSAAVVAVAVALAPAAASAQAVEGDREPHTLPEVEVTLDAQSQALASAQPAAVLTAQDFQSTTVRTIADLVALLPGVDVRVRGVGDAQGDLAMRGGSFDQALVLLNGVNLTDPQTGHHSLDIPIDLAMVQRVELLSPAQLMARGIVGFCGGVNIVVSDDYRDRLLASLTLGSHGTAQASVLAARALGQWATTAAATYSRSDGYMPNTDYRHGSLFLQAQRHGVRSDWHLQLGGQLKGFGSQAFYSTAYPDQYEATRTLTASAFNVARFGRARLETSLYGRLHADRFELFRSGYVDSVPAWYSGHNHHLSSLAGLRARAVLPLGVGEGLAGAEVRREGVRSNVLGEADPSTVFGRSASRTACNLFAGYGLASGPFSAEATALATCNTRFGFNYGLAANLEYGGKCLKASLSAARTFRLPTFTDLYYQGANQRANPDLNAESGTTVDAALAGTFRRAAFRLSAYYRDGTGIIDWVRRPDSNLWFSMNHTAVAAYGLDASAVLRGSVFALRVAYSWCHIEQDTRGLLSGSVIDYLAHHAQAHLTVEPAAGLRLKAGATYRFREGRYDPGDGLPRPYGGVVLLSAAAEYDIRQCTLFVEGHNLLDAAYRDVGGVPQPGRTLTAGVRVAVR